jgi:hypothetical protein
MMTHSSDEEQRQRIIEVVRKKALVDCPTLVVERIEDAGHAVTVFFWCEEEDAQRAELVQGLILDDEDAEYIGVGKTARGNPETDE